MKLCLRFVYVSCLSTPCEITHRFPYLFNCCLSFHPFVCISNLRHDAYRNRLILMADQYEVRGFTMHASGLRCMGK